MKRYFLTLLGLCFATALLAIPAKRIKRTITLTDGSQVTATFGGDEYLHYYTDASGNRYVAQADGRYAPLSQERLALGQQRRAAANRARMMRGQKSRATLGATSNPVSGQKKGLVILVNFADKALQYTQADFNDYFNKVGYNKHGMEFSVHDYFYRCSYGQFDLTFDVVGPVTVSKNMSYYGSNDADGNDQHPAEMVSEAIHLAAAFPDWSVRRAFTAQIIINHLPARDGEFIDNMEQAMDRAVANGVKVLVVQPTHLMHGAEYDEMMDVLSAYEDQFESISVAEPLLGEVGSDATVINADKEAVAQAVVTAAAADAGFADAAEAAAQGTAFVLMGHGTAHVAKVSYSQMQTQMQTLGYDNVFIGTVEGEPEETSCEAVIEAVKAAGYTKVVLRPLMVVAGDHANNDMAGAEEDSWKSMFEAAGCFDSVTAQIAGLGSIEAVQNLYIAHTRAVIDTLN